MLERCVMLSSDISKLEVLNTTNIAEAVEQMGGLRVTRILVTDSKGLVVYDSHDGQYEGSYALYPEIIKAFTLTDSFTWLYHDGVMISKAAATIYTASQVTGCVYMMEYDAQQGALLQNLQRSILMISVILVLIVSLFSIVFTGVFSSRMRKIMASMRIIRSGDYSHKVSMGGHDELTFLADEVNRLTDRLEETEQEQRQFVSDASHELKTPLASIKLLSDSILQNDMDATTIREFVGDIGNEADRLTRMSAKLLSLSKVESLDLTEHEIIFIAPTIHRAVRMLRGIAQKNNIQIEMDFSDDCPILILEDDLYQIAFNLAENGIKYNIPGGKLSIRVHRDGENAVIRFTDTGVGIPEDAIGHIFERFYRVDKARSRKSGGSGLGLAIVRTIAQKHQGEITVHSTLGKGSEFVVTFPAFDIEEDVP